MAASEDFGAQGFAVELADQGLGQFLTDHHGIDPLMLANPRVEPFGKRFARDILVGVQCDESTRDFSAVFVRHADHQRLFHGVMLEQRVFDH